MIQLWREVKVCDATITADGRTFSAHRNVLMVCSEYFNGAFSAGLEESTSAHVTLQEVSASAVEATLDFMYTGECLFPEPDLGSSLLHAAAYLQVMPLVESIALALQARLTPENCLNIRSLAQTYDLEELVSAAHEVALKHFGTVASTDAFVGLSHAHVLELVSDERLVVEQEEAVYETAIKWARAQRTPPDDATLLPILSAIRYPLTSRAWFEEVVLKEPLLHSALAAQLFASAFMTSAFGPRVQRRRGFGPKRAEVTWSEEHKGSNIRLESGRLKARCGEEDVEGQAVRSHAPLPATGCFFVELMYYKVDPDETRLGGNYFTGAIAGNMPPWEVFSADSFTTDGHFWGFDDSGETITRSQSVDWAPTDARNPEDGDTDDLGSKYLFLNRDTLQLHFDREARTLSLHRNGKETSLVIRGLPPAGEELYLLATPWNEDSHVAIIDCDECTTTR